MSDTKIEWATKAWNIVEGCTKVSAGCKFCYAERLAKRARRDFSKVTLHPERLDQPRHWRQPQTVFVCSRSDPFHREVPSWFLRQVFTVMEYTPQHRYLMLTKRPELAYTSWNWPENVWLGVSGEDQENATGRLTELMKVARTNQIRHLFFSGEPLLGPLDFASWIDLLSVREADGKKRYIGAEMPGIEWVIVGGESGGPPERRLVERCDCGYGVMKGVRHEKPYPDSTHTVTVACRDCGQTSWCPKPEALEWVRSIRDQCQAAGVPFFFKQWPIPPHCAGGSALLDGREWREVPS